MSSSDPGVGESTLLDHLAIQRLQASYADVVTRRAFEELSELFVEEMPLHLDTGAARRDLAGPEEIGEFIDHAVSRFAFFEFVPLNAHIELYPDDDSDAATARWWMCEVRCAATDNGDAGEWSTAFGLYRDRFVRRDGRWWFGARRYRSLARTGAEGAVLPFPDFR